MAVEPRFDTSLSSAAQREVGRLLLQELMPGCLALLVSVAASAREYEVPQTISPAPNRVIPMTLALFSA